MISTVLSNVRKLILPVSFHVLVLSELCASILCCIKSNDGRLCSKISPFYLGLCSILDCSLEGVSCRLESDVDFVLFLHRNSCSDILLNVVHCFFFLEMS